MPISSTISSAGHYVEYVENPWHPRVSLTFPRSPSKQATSPPQKPPRLHFPQSAKIDEIFPLRNPLIDGGTQTTLARRNRFAPPELLAPSHPTQQRPTSLIRTTPIANTSSASSKRIARNAASASPTTPSCPITSHLVAIGDRPDAISLFMMNANGQYSAYLHAAQKPRGHL